MRDGRTRWRGVAVLVLGQGLGCLSLSTGDGGVPDGGQGGAGGNGGAGAASSSTGATTSSSGAGGGGSGGGSAHGEACIAAPDCTSGFCVDGVCCDAACDGACMSCARPESIGACSNLPSGEEDPGTCTITSACDGSGACKSKNGQPCASDVECLSNNCSGGAPKTCAP